MSQITLLVTKGREDIKKLCITENQIFNILGHFANRNKLPSWGKGDFLNPQKYLPGGIPILCKLDLGPRATRLVLEIEYVEFREVSLKMFQWQGLVSYKLVSYKETKVYSHHVHLDSKDSKSKLTMRYACRLECYLPFVKIRG